MRCIFCKSSTVNCKSVEHIVPESLGNKEHILPVGWVCDKCNNYLACNVEAPFLNSWYGRNSRFEMRVASKRGKVPPVTGIHVQSKTKIDVYVDNDDDLGICSASGENEKQFIRNIMTNTHGTLCIPVAELPAQDYNTARFIGKVSLEAFAYQCMNVPSANKEIVDQIELDELRNYVRQGKPGFIWPVHMRRIYPADFRFFDGLSHYEILHEWVVMPLISDSSRYEYYVVIAIFGIEYVINLGNPELNSFHRWLKDNNNASFLYTGKK